MAEQTIRHDYSDRADRYDRSRAGSAAGCVPGKSALGDGSVIGWQAVPTTRQR